MSSEGLKHKYFSLKAKWMVKKQQKEVAKVRLQKNITHCKVAFLTTAGVHLVDQKPFDVESGDHTVHFIPKEATIDELVVTHTHYDTKAAKEDINCVFPLQMLREFEKEGLIGEVSDTHYGMMGFIPRTERLLQESIPIIIHQLKKEKVDLLLASPG